jgi:uncharacterized protein YjbI with pentapeptide repeats
MAFLFRPTIPTEGMEGLSLPADPSPVKAVPAPVASSPEAQFTDDAVLQEFLRRNFLTEGAAVESSSAEISAPKIELPSADDFGPALENLGSIQSGESTAIGPADEHQPSDLTDAGLVPETPRIDAAEWAIEETLANHKEWLDSHGEAGKKADLRKARLEGTELIGVNLRHADLQGATLKSADLLLADLRDTCLVRSNLQETCLVGANFEGANLQGASLDSAMGLLPRQLAGANLHEASLPAQILEFNAFPTFAAGSKTVARLFATIMIVSFLSFAMIWKTKDIQLLADSAIISFLHSPAAAAAIPTDQIYLLAPALLVALFLFFLYRLQELWDAVLELPAVFPDGRLLGHNGPRIVTGLLRTHFRWMDQDSHSTRMIEKSFSVLLAYWAVPVILLLYWARYLTLQDFHGTLLHQVLLLVAVGVAFYCSTQIGRPAEKWATEEKPTPPVLEKLKALRPATVLATLFVTMSLLAAGTIAGVPQDKQRAPQFSSIDPRRWASRAMWIVGYDPYAELTEASISLRPENWSGAEDQIPAVRGARLNGTKFRYAQAYGIFLVNAHLFKADLQGAFLSGADLRNADLGQANLQFAILDRANLQHANLDRAQLDGANCSRTDLRGANLSYSSIVGASLPDARLDGASLYSTNLQGASLLRGNLEKADLREAHLANANLEGADLQQSYLWSAKLPGANLRKSQLATAIFIDADLQNADLSGAQLNGTVLNGANLQGAMLDGADLRGVLQLTATQVCSTKSRNGALFDEALRSSVDSQCGGAPPPKNP